MIHSDHVDQLAPDVSGLVYSCVAARSKELCVCIVSSVEFEGTPGWSTCGSLWGHIVSRPTLIEADTDIHVIIWPRWA
jgi:hypothetical protein